MRPNPQVPSGDEDRNIFQTRYQISTHMNYTITWRNQSFGFNSLYGKHSTRMRIISFATS